MKQQTMEQFFRSPTYIKNHGHTTEYIWYDEKSPKQDVDRIKKWIHDNKLKIELCMWTIIDEKIIVWTFDKNNIWVWHFQKEGPMRRIYFSIGQITIQMIGDLMPNLLITDEVEKFLANG